MGAKEGSLYLVYADGKSILGMHGELIGRERINLAVIKISEVSNSHSTCEVVPSGGDFRLIRRGDKIEPIASRAARNVKFASSRPAASSEAFEMLFGDGSNTSTASVTLAGDPTDNRLSEIAGSGTASLPDPAPTQSQQVESVITPPQVPLGEPESTQQSVQQGEPVITPPLILQGEPSATSQLLQPQRRDFNPNVSDEAKVIETYPITADLASQLIKGHNDAISRIERRDFRDAYRRFNRLLDDYNGNYLAAFWAGKMAERLGNKGEAHRLYNKSLEINPNYVPAQNARDDLFR
jgi:hypothetical protein